MKNYIKVGQFIVALVFVIFLSGCNLSSDSETEGKLDGTWRTLQYETEDGMQMKVTETVTYNAGSHTFDAKMSLDLVSPLNMKMLTLKYSGTWRATKSKLIGTIDKNSLDFSFSNMVDKSDRTELEKEFMHELEKGSFIDGGKILEISSDEFKLEDESDGTLYEYKRVND